jgi:hypothetical protein
MTTWTVIDSLDAPASNVFDFPALDFTGYQVAQVVCSGVTVTTDGTDILLTLYVGTEVVTGYRWGMQTITSNTVLNDDGDTSDPAIALVSNDAGFDVGNPSTTSFGGILTIDNPLSTALYKRVRTEVVFDNASDVLVAMNGGGIMENAGAITGLKISGSSALTAGKVRVLGLA